MRLSESKCSFVRETTFVFFVHVSTRVRIRFFLHETDRLSINFMYLKSMYEDCALSKRRVPIRPISLPRVARQSSLCHVMVFWEAQILTLLLL